MAEPQLLPCPPDLLKRMADDLHLAWAILEWNTRAEAREQEE